MVPLTLVLVVLVVLKMKTSKARIRPVSFQSENGLAIITVLLIIALMVTLLGFMIEQQHLLIRRIANQNVSEQGHQYALGIEAWASRVLHEDADRVIDYAGDDWARFGEPPKDKSAEEYEEFSLDLSSVREREELPVIDFEFDGLEYQIEDLQGRYNLNNLANPDGKYLLEQKNIFFNLLEQLEVGEFDAREQLYGALVDWLDENDARFPNGGVESGDYRVKDTPYNAADQKLTSLGELRYVEGFTQEIINALAPYVTVLPVDNARININTTTAEVMASLSKVPVVDTASVDGFLFLREDPAFLGFQPGSIHEAQTAIIRTVPSGGGYTRQMLQTNSQFFVIRTNVTLGDYRYCTETTVLRENNASPGTTTTATTTTPTITVINRQHNTLCNEIIR